MYQSLLYQKSRLGDPYDKNVAGSARPFPSVRGAGAWGDPLNASTAERISARLLDGIPTPQRYWAVVSIAISVMLASLSTAIANIALPTIARELAVSPASAIWVTNAYQIAMTVLILPLASIGDIVGHSKVYRTGLAVFTLAAFVCAFADSLPMLTFGRMLQGMGAAGILACNTALVRFTYPRAMLGRGMSVNSFVVATSAASGPSIAAAILSLAPWPWLFAVNIPLGALAFFLSRNLPYIDGTGARFDFQSALYAGLAFGLLIIGIDALGHGHGFGLFAALIAISILSGFLLVRRQAKLATPMLAVDLFKRPVFALSVSTSVLSYTAQGLGFVSLPFYFHDVLGQSQVAIGLLMTPWPVTVMITAPIAGYLSDRYPAGILCCIGSSCLALGLVLLAFLPPDPEPLNIAWRMAICGFGFGFFQTPNNRAIVTSAPRERSGGASGFMSSARLLGQATGASSVALIFGMFAAQGAPESAAVTFAVLTGATFAAVGAGVSLLRQMDFRRDAAANAGD